MPDNTADVRFERHARYMRTLKEDTLLIVDNFNATAEEDALLAEVMAYRCKVLFTTRCRFEEYPMLELNEISDQQALLQLMSCFYSAATLHQDTLAQIIETVHSHTLVDEMSALLADNALGTPEDRAMLLSYQAMCANSPAAAIRLQEQALSMLTEITIDNALLASNLYANLGGMYRGSGNYIKAQEHTEEAISLLRQYNQLAYHDSIPQVVNYAMLLTEMEHAAVHHQKCLAVYAELFPDQRDILSAKQADLRLLYEQVGAINAPETPRIA